MNYYEIFEIDLLLRPSQQQIQAAVQLKIDSWKKFFDNTLLWIKREKDPAVKNKLKLQIDQYIAHLFTKQEKQLLNNELKVQGKHKAYAIKVKAVFEKIQKAGEILCNPSQRSSYDKKLRFQYTLLLPPVPQLEKMILDALILEEKEKGHKLGEVRLPKKYVNYLLSKWQTQLGIDFEEDSINRGGFFRLRDDIGNYYLDALAKDKNNNMSFTIKGGFGKTKFLYPMSINHHGSPLAYGRQYLVAKILYDHQEMQEEYAEEVKKNPKLPPALSPEELEVQDQQNEFLSKNAVEISQRLKDKSVRIIPKMVLRENGVWESDNKRGCYVMQRFPGENLAKIIADIKHLRKPALPFQAVYEISLNMLKELKHYHDAGIKHRDAHTANFMINLETGEVNLVDREFALTKDNEDKDYPYFDSHNKKTYMSKFGLHGPTPVYYRAQDLKWTEKKDCYALGKCLEELLSCTDANTTAEEINFISYAIKKLTLSEPSKRWSINQTMDHLQGPGEKLIRKVLSLLAELHKDFLLSIEYSKKLNQWKKIFTKIRSNPEIATNFMNISYRNMSKKFSKIYSQFLDFSDTQAFITGCSDNKYVLELAFKALILLALKEQYRHAQKYNGIFTYVLFPNPIKPFLHKIEKEINEEFKINMENEQSPQLFRPPR